MAGVIEL